MAKDSKAYRQLLRVFGHNLRTLRQQRNFTQEQAAALIGVHVRHYQKLECGQVNFTARTIARVGVAYQLDPNQLVVESSFVIPY